MSEIITVGLDLVKNVFQVHGADASGLGVLRKKLRRDQVLAFFSYPPPCLGCRLIDRQSQSMTVTAAIRPQMQSESFVQRGLHIVSRKKSRRGVSRNIVYFQITRRRPSLLSQIRRDPLLIAGFFAHLRTRRPLRAHTQAERYGHEISSSCRCPVEQHRWRCIR